MKAMHFKFLEQTLGNVGNLKFKEHKSNNAQDVVIV